MRSALTVSIVDNLSELGDFGFDFMDDDDDEALRSIESGKFNIERESMRRSVS